MNTSKKYEFPEEEPMMASEAAVAMEYDVRKVNVAHLMSQGYMTLEQSKALIEEKIYNHFHN